MTLLWTQQKITEAVGGVLDASKSQPIYGVSIDSRSVEKGDVFFALKGLHHDGHDYIDKAFIAGASCCVINQEQKSRWAEKKPHGALIAVNDSFDALKKLAKAARNRTKAKLFAVTGSVGKTSTKATLTHALSVCASVYMGKGNLNNHIGVPLSLARLPERVDFGIFELGSNQPGDITPLTRLVVPHIAMITNIQPAHIGNFSGINAIAEEKSCIFDALSPAKIALLPRDDRFFDPLVGFARKAGIRNIVSFGTDKDADYRLCAVKADGESTIAETMIAGHKIRWRIAALGKHWAMIGLTVLAIVDQLGGDVQKATNALETMVPLDGRGRRLLLDLSGASDITLIDESYNASPASLRAAFSSLSFGKASQHRKLCVLGDMLELGNDAANMHRDLVPFIKAAKIERVFTTGPYSKILFDLLPPSMQALSADKPEQLIPAIKAELKDHDILLVKGSAGSKISIIVETLKKEGIVKKQTLKSHPLPSKESSHHA